MEELSCIVYYFIFNLIELKQASESKLLEIQTEKNKQKDELDSMENSDKIKTIQENLQVEIQITTVIQHVFQVRFIYIRNEVLKNFF